MTLDLNKNTPKLTFNSTQRARPPEQTLSAMTPLMTRFGVTRLANITGLDHIGMPVAIAIRPTARSLTTSQGKGETIATAKVSALMEAIECWHAEYLSGPLVYESWKFLSKSQRAVDPLQLPLRFGVNIRPDAALSWISGYNIVTGEEVLIPFETVSLNHVRQPGHLSYFNSGSNGLASGNNLAEAVLHGLYELVERDANALFGTLSRDGWKAKQVDISTVRHPYPQSLLEKLERVGVFVSIFDITSDIDIPTYMASVVDGPSARDALPIPFMTGYGTHSSPAVALSRAIHEAVQIRLSYVAASRDDIFASQYRTGSAGSEQHLKWLSEPEPSYAFREEPKTTGSTFEADILDVVEKLSAAGLSTPAMVDLTRDDVGVSVVRVIVPGLEGASRNALYTPGIRARRLRSNS